METVKYSGRLIQLVHLKNGKRTFEIARRGPGVRILFHNDSHVLLTLERRREVGGFDVRVPGGKVFNRLDPWLRARDIDGEVEREALRAATEESEQEVGLRPIALHFMGKQVCGATMEWDLYCYSCTEWEDLGTQNLEPGEDISVRWHTWSDAIEAALDGSMSESRSAVMVTRLAYKLGKLHVR